MASEKILIGPVLIALNDTAIKTDRNRAFNPDWLATNIDPDGLHIIYPLMLHNDVEWRCQVYVKVIGSLEPVIGFLDVSPADWKRVERADALVRAEMDRQDQAQAQESVDA